MDQLRFTLPEVFSLIGVFQCVYILVYVGFRARKNFIRVILPLLYFFILGCAFLLDMARSTLFEITPYYDVLVWGMWNLTIPLGVLLIIQMAQIKRLPHILNWLILAVVPFSYIISKILILYFSQECSEAMLCDGFFDWLNISGVIGGALSLLIIWGNRNLFSDIQKQKAGRERYWLILSLIILNTAFLCVMAFKSSGIEQSIDLVLLRTILGLAFVYLISTSLFRIYPLALFSTTKEVDDVLDDEGMNLISKIKDLLTLDKIYHEASYSRSDLAQELGLPEAAVSKLINVHFQKSFPQLLNEHRVEDAKRLLLETDASIKIVAQEVGFNSLSSFNRVFKDIIKQSPSDYRKNTIK